VAPLEQPSRGTWLAVHESASPPPEKPKPGEPPPENEPRPPPPGDMLVLALVQPSLWVDPAWAGTAPRVAGHLNVAVRDGIPTADFPLAGGRREWLLATLDQAASLALVGTRAAPPPHKLVIKHGDFPLDRVKDFVLEWKGDHENHPRLYVKKADIPELRKRVTSDPEELARWSGRQPIDKYFLDGPVKEFIATGDLKLGRLMAAKAEEYLQQVTDWYLKQDDKLTPGAAPHMQSLIFTVLNLVDPVLGSDVYTPEARQKVLARLAFIGYVVSTPDYWSPERGQGNTLRLTRELSAGRYCAYIAALSATFRAIDDLLRHHPPPPTRGREHPYHPGSGRRVREPGDALFHRQRLGSDGPPGREGVLPGQAPFPLMHIDTT
jgi:hypothetical protein